MRPLISIVIPNFNGELYIEEAIRSVVTQDYERVELIVIDGGSSDGSVETIRKYADRITYWESCPDKGQSDAINKGFAKANGDIINWLCSDDYLMPGALAKIAEFFERYPDTDVLAGRTRHLDVKTGESRDEGPNAQTMQFMPYRNVVQQPSCFYRKKLLRESAVKLEMHYLMDVELWAYLLKSGAKWRFTDETLSVYRWTGENKTLHGGERSWQEWCDIFRNYGGSKANIAILIAEKIRPIVFNLRDNAKSEYFRKVMHKADRFLARCVNTICGRESEHIANVYYGVYRQTHPLA